MTDQPKVVPKQSAELDADAVVAYLRAHPTFFAEHDELLLEQRIPHQRGDSVSLVERQLAAARSQHRNAPPPFAVDGRGP